MKKDIHVPARTINNERNIIAEKLRETAGTGTKRLDPTVVKFVRDGGDDDPDVEFVKRFVAEDGTVLLASD